jgi:hypothetical protein
MSAPAFAQRYFDNVVRSHGLQRQHYQRSGFQIYYQVWEALNKLCGTTSARTTACRPQTDGQMERVNQQSEEILPTYAYMKIGSPTWERQHLPLTTLHMLT